MASDNPKIVAIVQARMGSTRLPGKVLKQLEGEIVLARVLARLERAKTLGMVIVATSTTASDDVIVAECRRLGALVFRGEEADVLDRYYRAAQVTGAEVVVRITADCPLIDPEIVDKVVAAFLAERPDFASNALIRTYPRGLDTEVVSMNALGRSWRGATQPHERAHVMPYIYEKPRGFKILAVKGERDYSSLRWTLDTEQDLEFLRAVYARFDGRDDFGWRDVLSLLEREPALSEINRQVIQKTLREG